MYQSGVLLDSPDKQNQTEAGSTKKSNKIIQGSGQAFMEKFELLKKKQVQELWEKVEQSDELRDIKNLKDKLAKTIENRKVTNTDIQAARDRYDNLKIQLKKLIQEQTQSFHKLSFPKASSKYKKN